MKSFATLIAASMIIFAPSAFSCDEQCLKDKAQAKLNTKFAPYLSWKECDRVATSFMTHTMSSLKHFQKNSLQSRYKGPLKNIRSELYTQREWLEECNAYFQATKNTYIFDDAETTKQIYNSLDSVTEELTVLIDGAVYAGGHSDPESVINKRFDVLQQQVFDHKTLMDLKGKYVFR